MLNATKDELIKKAESYDKLVKQYEKVVEQNKSLQFELREKSMDITWNYASDVYFPSFVLRRHSWCSFLNTTLIIGFIDVEYPKDKRRCIYVGWGCGNDFEDDILRIEKWGTKLKEWREDE